MAKKRKKLFSKTALVYVLTFFVVTFCTAFLTVTVNYDNYLLNNSSNLMANTGNAGSSALSTTISNLMSITGGNVNVSMSAESEEGESLDIDANIKLKMQGGLDGFECSIDLVLYFNDEPFVLRVACIKGMVYISVNDSHLKFKADKFTDTIVGILGVVGMGADGAASIASMFDMNSLMSIASSIREVAMDNGTSLKVEDANMNVSMNVDDNYMLQSVDISSIAVGGYTASGAVTMSDINSSNIVIETPLDDTDYEDISVPIRLFSAIASLSNMDFVADARVDALGATIDSKIIYDKNRNIGKVSVGAGALDFDIYFNNGSFYLNSNNAKIKAEDLSATSFIAGLGVLSNEVGSYSESGTAFDASTLTKLDLSKIFNHFTLDGDKIKVSMLPQDIYFTLDSSDKITNISTNGDISCNIDFSYTDQSIYFDDFGYVPIQEMNWVLKPIMNFLQARQFSATIEFDYGELSGELMIRVDLADRRAIQINTELFGKKIEVIVEEDYILLRIDKESTKIRSQDSLLLALAIFDKFSGEIEIDTAINIQNVLDNAMQLVFADKNALLMQGKNSRLQYSADGTILFEGVILDKNLRLFIDIDKTPRKIRDYALNLYSDFVFTSELAQNTINYINGKVYNFSISGEYDGNKVDAKIFADLNDSRYVLDISFNNESVNIVCQDDVYYVQYRQFKFYGNLESAMGLLCSAISASSADKKLASSIESIVAEFAANMQDVDIIDVITGIKIGEINIADNSFEISMEKLAGLEKVLDIQNIKFKLVTEQHNIKTVGVDCKDTKLQIGISKKIEPRLTETEMAAYTISLDDLYALAINTYDYVQGGAYIFDIFAEYNQYSVEGKLSVINSALLADIAINIQGEEVFVKILEGNMYINYANLAFIADLNDLGLLMSIANKLGINITEKDLVGLMGQLLGASKLKFGENSFAELLSKISIDKIVFNRNESKYNVGYGYYLFTVNAVDNKLSGVSTNMLGTAVQITLSDAFDVTPVGDYVAVSDILKILSNEIDYAKGDMAFNIDFELNGKPINGKIYVSGGVASAVIQTKVMGQKFEVKLIGDTLYFDINGLKIRGNASDYDKLSYIVNKYTGINLPSITSFNINEIYEFYNELTLFAENNLGLKLPEIDKSNVEENIDPLMLLGALKNLIISNTDEGYGISLGGQTVYVETDNDKFVGLFTNIAGTNVSAYKDDFVKLTVNKDSFMIASDVINVVDKTVNTLSTKCMTGEIDLYFYFEGIQHKVEIDYNINFENLNDIRAKINAKFKGVDAEIIYIDKILYINAAGLKFYANIDDYKDILDFVRTRFGVETGIEDMLDEITQNFKNFEFIEGWIFDDKASEFSLKGGLKIGLNYSVDKISSVDFAQGLTSAHITLTPPEEMVTISEVTGNYIHYSEIFDLIDTVISMGDEEGFSVNANATVFEGENVKFDIGIDLDLTIKNMLGFYGNAKVKDGNDKLLYDVEVALENQTIYVDFDGLRLAMHQNSLREIFVIGLSVLGIDATSIPWLNAVDEEFKVVPENLKNIIPVLKLDTLGMISIIQSMSFENEIFEITLKGELISEQSTRPMTISIDFTGGQINSINLVDIYTGVTDSEYFNLYLEFEEFDSVPVIDKVDENGRKFNDISDSSDLFKALINTTELNDYTINGTVTFNAVDLINMNIFVEATVKKIADSFYAEINLSNIPVISLLNGTLGKTIKDRRFSIYMYDNIVYLHRTEYEYIDHWFSEDEYILIEKKLAITMEQFMGDMLDYIMCFGLGFKEDGKIMEAIYASIKQRPANDPIDLGNVLEHYEKDVNGLHYLILNMKEIAYNNDLKTLSAWIGTVNSADTGNKDYVGLLKFALDMQVMGFANLKLSSNDLQLINIGKDADVSYAVDYINSYKYKLGECYVISNGKETLESNLTYFAYFYNGTEIVRTQELNTGEALDLSGVNKPDAYIGEVKYAYTFNGWYTDAECTKLYTQTTMPTGGIALYAGFTPTAYRYVYFDEQGGGYVDYICTLAGNTVQIPTLANKFETIGAYTYEYKHVGWVFEGETYIDSFILPDKDVILVAEWEYVGQTAATALLTIVFGDGSKVEDRIEVGTTINFSQYDGVVSTTKFYKDNAFTTLNDVTVMPFENIVLYAANVYTITFSTGTNQKVIEKEAYEGENVYLETNVTRAYYDDGSVRIDYTFLGWYFADDADTLYNGSIKMPNGGGQLIAKWRETTRNYVTISFKVDTIRSIYTWHYSAAPTSIKWLEGEYFEITVPQPTAYRNKLFGGTQNATFKGWKYNGSVVPGFYVNGNTTLEASWST